MMRWSKNTISRKLALFFIFLVKLKSVELGFKAPEGWLWATMIPVAHAFKAMVLVFCFHGLRFGYY